MMPYSPNIEASSTIPNRKIRTVPDREMDGIVKEAIAVAATTMMAGRK